ncbi:MAG: hypothetical protein ACTHWO_10720 [Nesterenkonia sp.]
MPAEVHLASVLAVSAADTLGAAWGKRLQAGAKSVGLQSAPTD